MFGCSRKTHKPALTRVEEVRTVERYETLSVYVPVAETVRSYVPVIVPRPEEAPVRPARQWWPGWLVLGLIAIAVIVYAVSRR